MSIISIILTIYFNNHGLLGYLPLISGLIYLWFMTVKDVIKFKILIIVSVVFWLIYDFIIQSYTASVFDLITIIKGYYFLSLNSSNRVIVIIRQSLKKASELIVTGVTARAAGAARAKSRLKSSSRGKNRIFFILFSRFFRNVV